MMKHFTVLIGIVISFLTIYHTVQSQAIYQPLDERFEHYQILSIESTDLKTRISADRSEMVSLDLMGYHLQLFHSNIIANNYIVRINDESGTHAVPSSRPFPMNGYTTKGGRVSLTFNDNFIYGFIQDGTDMYFIEPLYHFVKSAKKDEFVVYKANDIKDTGPKTCGVTEMHNKLEVHRNEGNARTGLCYEVDYAVASDFLMFQSYGSVAAVENNVIGVTNDVQTNYDDEFADGLNFIIVEQFVSTTSNEPWTSSTNPNTLLNSFRNWGPSGFFNDFDVASLWSDRDFDGDTVGLAFVSAVCSSFKYNVLQDFTSNSNFKREMTAHELGHNFGAVSSSDTGHDPPGSPYIMAPVVQNSTIWSTASKTDIQSYYQSVNCLSSCSNIQAPDAFFEFSVTEPCAPGIVHFTDASSGAITNWSWSFPGGNPSTSNLVNPTVTYANPGVYSATLTVSNGGGSNSYNVNSEIVIYGPPTPDFATQINGLTAFFTYLGAPDPNNSYLWDFGDSQTSTDENPSHTYLNDGVYQVFLSVVNDCGDGFVTDQVVIATPPTSDFSAFPISGCNPHFVQFESMASSNTTSFSWSFPGGNPATSTEENPTVTYSTPGSYNVTLVASNAQGSNTKTKQNYIVVNAAPVPGFTYAASGNFYTFTNTSTNATSYLWNFGDGMTSTSMNPTHTYANSGTFTVTLTADNNNCSPVLYSQIIEVSFSPTAQGNATSPTSGCAPLTVTFQNTSTNNPVSINWIFDGGNPSTSTSNNPTVVYSQAGMYDVILIATNSFGSDTLLLENYINVMTLPIAGISAVQNGPNINLMSQSTGASSLEWTLPDGTTFSQTEINYVFPGNGTYMFSLTASNDCGTDIETYSITVTQFPSANITSDSQSGCTPDAQVQFFASSAPNASYNWVFQGGSPSTSMEQNPVVTYQNAGLFDVSLIVSNDFGQDQSIINNYVNIATAPQSIFSYSQNNAEYLFTNQSQSASGIAWILPDGSSASQNEVNYTFTENGTYEVTLIASNNCGLDTSSQSIVISQFPEAQFSLSGNSGCFPLSIQYTSQDVANGSYLWTFPGGTPASSTDQNPLVTYNSVGLYDVSLEVTNGFGQDQMTLVNAITVYGAPTSNFTTTLVDNVLTTFNSSSNATTYEWNFGDGETSDESNPTHEYLANGSYTLSLISTSPCGSDTSYQSIEVLVAAPIIFFEQSVNVGCAPLEVHFEDQSQNNPESWSWQFPGGQPSTSTVRNPTITYDEPGSYSVTVSVTNSAGTSTKTIQNAVTVNGKPEAMITYTAQDGLIDFMSNASGANTYLWNFGDSELSSEENPRHMYDRDGEYTVTLTVTNECGTITISEKLLVILSSTLESSLLKNILVYPNPVLDELVIKSIGIKDLGLRLFNINGTEIGVQRNITNMGEIKTINMSNLVSGIYVLKLYQGKDEKIIKIVKI